MNRSYRKGYYFEARVRKKLEEDGWFCIRQGKSKFPDFLCVRAMKIFKNIYENRILFVECKWNKYLSKKEKKMTQELLEKIPTAKFLVAYNDKGKIKYYSLNMRRTTTAKTSIYA